MAKIFPNHPPQSIINDPKRSAELDIYQRLQNLPNQYTVFYNMHWQAARSDGGARESEADFIIAHPNKGIIILEVKGGGITFDGETGTWYSQSRSGIKFEIKDPVDQARESHYAIKRQLEKLPGWPKRLLNIWHAVCFPDIYLESNQSLKPDLPRESIIDANDKADMSQAIERVFRFQFGSYMDQGAPGYDRMQMIENLLATSFQFRTPLGVDLAHEEAKLIELTDQQFRALSLLGRRKRAAISGCAGSGKTMLAIKKAEQFKQLGMSVLLICYNAALAADIRNKLPEIEVYHFHDLCRQAAKQVGIDIQSNSDDPEFYNSTLPEILMDAGQEIGRIYDAIIVDEGQDFKENYWIALESLLKEDGYLYVFYDNNQNLYGGVGQFGGLITDEPFLLTQNCRNTKSIHNLVASYHNDPSSLECYGPDGRDPIFIVYKDKDDLLRNIQKLLHQLVVEEHIANDDIVILTPHGENNSVLLSGTKMGLFTLVNKYPDHQSKIQVTSIQKFKGLEKKVIILAEIDERVSHNYEMLMYVGCSRARTQLLILKSNNLSEDAPELRNKT